MIELKITADNAESLLKEMQALANTPAAIKGIGYKAISETAVTESNVTTFPTPDTLATEAVEQPAAEQPAKRRGRPPKNPAPVPEALAPEAPAPAEAPAPEAPAPEAPAPEAPAPEAPAPEAPDYVAMRSNAIILGQLLRETTEKDSPGTLKAICASVGAQNITRCPDDKLGVLLNELVKGVNSLTDPQWKRQKETDERYGTSFVSNLGNLPEDVRARINYLNK